MQISQVRLVLNSSYQHVSYIKHSLVRRPHRTKIAVVNIEAETLNEPKIKHETNENKLSEILVNK